MMLTFVFCHLINTAAPVPVDTVPRSNFSPVIGLQVHVADHQPLKLALGAVLGCAYTHAIGDNWALQVGMQGRVLPGYELYTRLADTLALPDAYSQVSAEFNVRSVVYVDLPVTLHRRFGSGGRQTWLFGVKPSMNALTRNQADNRWSTTSIGKTNNNPAFKALNIRDGFHRYDIGLLAGWSCRLRHGLVLDLRYQQGLVDLTADNFFKSDELTLDSGLQLTLRYGL
jgi:hypothetical protein